MFKHLTYTFRLKACSDWQMGNARKNSVREEAMVYFFRFWIRALLGDFKLSKTIENAIFGSTSQCSSIKFSLSNDSGEEVIKKGNTAVLRMTYSSDEAKEKYHELTCSLLKVGSYLGGVGGKTVRGSGSFKILLDDYVPQTNLIDEIENSLKEVYTLLSRVHIVLKDPNQTKEGFILPKIEKNGNSLSLSGQKDRGLRYPYLLEIREINLLTKSINDAFEEERDQDNNLLNGRKFEILQTSFPESVPNVLRDMFGSLKPRYQSPISVSHWNDKNIAIFTLFKSSNPSFIHNIKNAKRVFEETCKTFDK
jgi:CRISPR type III-B/RAMP module RAMP protein Cmr1